MKCINKITYDSERAAYQAKTTFKEEKTNLQQKIEETTNDSLEAFKASGKTDPSLLLKMLQPLQYEFQKLTKEETQNSQKMLSTFKLSVMKILQVDNEIYKIKMMDTLAKKVNEQGEVSLTKRKLQEFYNSNAQNINY